MPKVVVTAQVEEPVRWEEGFRTHGELFRSYTVDTPVTFGITEGNEVAICLEPADLDAFTAGMESAATAEAMEADGINRDTVKVFIMDKEFQP